KNARSVTADAQGNAQLPVTETIALRSIWVAIDLPTGAVATASPAGFTPGAFDLVPGTFLDLGPSFPSQLVDSADYAEVLVVRPGISAWNKSVGRGGPDDLSSPGDNGFVLSLTSLDFVAGAVNAPPQEWGYQDLVIIVHPAAMEIGIGLFEGKS